MKMEIEAELAKPAGIGNDAIDSEDQGNCIVSRSSSSDEERTKPALSRTKRIQKLSSGSESESESNNEAKSEVIFENHSDSFPVSNARENDQRVSLDNDSESSDADDSVKSPKISKSRIRKISDSSGSESPESLLSKARENDQAGGSLRTVSFEKDSERSSNADDSVKSPKISKSRIRKNSDSSGSDSPEPLLSSRIRGKRNKLQQKFKNLLSEKENEDSRNAVKQSSSSDDEAASIEKIKQKIKERTVHLKSTIYDPDTSDEETSLPKSVIKYRKERKSTKLTSPKPARMSAKQAMENMQKIRSESNRMLREKEVSLPYHRPRALSLKDILSRRRLALSADGKALPIKMNDEQLRQYAGMLEQRQKEMMELCKSESEEDEEKPEDEIKETNTEKENPDYKPEELNSEEIQAKNKELTESKNDSMFDELAKLHNDSTSIEIESVEPTDIVCNHFMNEGSSEKVDNNAGILSDKNLESTINTETMDINDANKSGDETNTTSINIDKKACKSVNLESEDLNNSEEMELTYNDSIESNGIADSSVNNNSENESENINNEKKLASSEVESQLITLYFDSEKTDVENLDKIESVTKEDLVPVTNIEEKVIEDESKSEERVENINNTFSDDDLNCEDIDRMIEDAEILSQNKIDTNFSPMLTKESQPLITKPKLTGAPGMVIDLDGTDPFAPKKTGVELLKERFNYFSKLKTPEEIEREREKRIKPGLLHLKLKQQLEEQIAEQRSLEWAKRLEEEKQQQKEKEAVMGNESDSEDDIDKIDAKLEELENVPEEDENSSESEEEEIEDLVDKSRKRNPLVDDEAEESDCDEEDDKEENIEHENEDDNKDVADENEANDADEEDEDEESEESSDEGSDDEENEQKKPKKGRILRAFEDSDDEETSPRKEEIAEKNDGLCEEIMDTEKCASQIEKVNDNPVTKFTQDEEIQLAQRHKSFSDDLFTSQESAAVSLEGQQKVDKSADDKEMGTQTFSILDSGAEESNVVDVPVPDNLFVGVTQNDEEGNLDHVVGMCSGSFSQSLVASQFPETQKSLDLGEDVLALCTGKFYDNQFVSQLDEDDIKRSDTQNNDYLKENNEYSKEKTKSNVNEKNFRNTSSEDTSRNFSQCIENIDAIEPSNTQKDDLLDAPKDLDSTKSKIVDEQTTADNVLLKSILDELHDPEFDKEKPMKYFGNDDGNKENYSDNVNVLKKKFVIDSDDEDGSKEMNDKKKKFKKKKMEKRALQISDDEEDENEEIEDEEEYASEIENEDRIVEYDSEENEVVVQPEARKKKRKVADFFENEAELTSEDEWAGSGDEDERGLDRMEREAGDDEQFNQRQLQAELEQIHMRDVLDQDKREVRMIQELLFEDGDLGVGGRQRKFRWRNADDGDENDMPYELTDTQEEEFESEEQWRKQRHEREMFLKQLKQEDADESLNTSVNRTSIIKANLSCKGNLSTMILEMNESKSEVVEKSHTLEKKSSKDIPSPKKPFAFQQNNYNSLLNRGRGALARLAALAMPLAGDDDAPKVGSLAPSSKRNFVFASITPDDETPKVTIKRKAESSVGTPRLVKKMKTEDKAKVPKSSLLDHLKT